MRVGLEQKARAWKGEDFSEPFRNLPHPVFCLASVVHSAPLHTWGGDGFPRPTLSTLPTWRGAGREDGRRQKSGWSFQPPDSRGHSPRDLCAPYMARSLCLHVEHPPGPSALQAPRAQLLCSSHAPPSSLATSQLFCLFPFCPCLKGTLPLLCWSQPVPACESRSVSFQEFCKPGVKLKFLVITKN